MFVTMRKYILMENLTIHGSDVVFTRVNCPPLWRGTYMMVFAQILMFNI